MLGFHGQEYIAFLSSQSALNYNIAHNTLFVEELNDIKT